MKKFLIMFVMAALPLLSYAQLDLSLRDTRFASIGYTLKNHWLFRIESSVLSADASHQNGRVYAGYTHKIKGLTGTILPYAGMAWNADYKLSGAIINAKYNILGHAIVEATYNPHWDSMYGFDNCYMAGVEIPATKEMSVVARFQNIPEYRVVAKRVRVGLKFKVNNLIVKPEVSFAPNKELKPIRMIVDFCYSFPGTKK